MNLKISITIILLICGITNQINAFVITRGRQQWHPHQCKDVVIPSFISLSASPIVDGNNEQYLHLDIIKSMRVKDIKQELQSVGIKTEDVFEKDELVKRLFEYRSSATKTTTTTREPPPLTTKPTNNKNTSSLSSSSSTISRIPLNFFSLTPDQSVQSRNSNVFIRPSPGKYPSIQLNIQNQSNKNNSKQSLTLLVDTACTGLVLRPNIVQQYNLPIMNRGGVSMTAAGGTTMGASMYRIDSAVLEDGTEVNDMMLVEQDIGALPTALDGIIGLDFLKRFTFATFDFENSELFLGKNCNNNNNNDNTEQYFWNNDDEADFGSSTMKILAESEMKTCKIGVWTVNVTLDGRGPVKMLLDTGAASSFLNWKGVQNMNLNKDHSLIVRNKDSIGAMGADNNAFELSHRFVLKRRINLTSDPSKIGPFDPLGVDINSWNDGIESSTMTDSSAVNIDIGDLPVLETLRSDNVGGILGSDILMRCDVLHLNLLSKSSPKVTLFARSSEQK